MRTTEHFPKPEETVSWRTWLAVVALGASSLAIVTTELAPIGLLSTLAAEFGQTEGTAGLIVTAYALASSGAPAPAAGGQPVELPCSKPARPIAYHVIAPSRRPVCEPFGHQAAFTECWRPAVL